MPGDRLPFAVRVSRKIEVVGLLERFGDGVDVSGVTLDKLIFHGEVVLRIDCPLLGDQVAHVAVGGQYLKALAQVFLDGFRLGRRFHYDQIFTHARYS